VTKDIKEMSITTTITMAGTIILGATKDLTQDTIIIIT
jgi:hypothetical protein